MELSETDGGSLMEYDQTTRLFRVRTAYGTSEATLDQLRRARIHADETWVGQCAYATSSFQIEDLTTVDRDAHLEILHADGWRSLVAVPLRSADRVVGAFVVRRRQPGVFDDEVCDLLSAFASQSAVALTNARLYQELARQSLELTVASQHKSEFLASMSHELRTPLNAVIGFSEVLLERMFGDLNERQEDYLRDIRDAGRHLLALLNDVLDLSKVEAGQMELELTTFDAAAAFHYALSLVRERAAQHRIGLALDVSEDLKVVRADELRFRQVLLNLLSNAVKFTDDGGSVAVSAWLEGSDLFVTVTDTGVGSPTSTRSGSSTRSSRAAGSWPARRAPVSASRSPRGSCSCTAAGSGSTSAPGVGSSFGFSIPGQAAGGTRDSVAPADAALGDPRPTVVVVEDDERSGELVALHLTAAGLRPVVIRDGREGLAAVRSLRPVAVILDIKLPGMSGWEILHAVKSDPDIAGTPVVVVSVLPERGKGFALGAADYLVKPVDKEELILSVRRVVAAATSQAGGRTIVVVDDDPMALELVRVTLEPQGWAVEVCERGADAIELVASTRPSVVLVDLLMPETDGFAVIESLASRPETADIPVVVLTAKSLEAGDRERLDGRIAFVASKSALDLDVLAQRLVRVSRPAASGAP